MKSKRYAPIQDIAAAAAHRLSRAMADAGLKVAEFDRQRGQLQSYRDEYARHSEAAGPMDVVKLQNFRAFLERLGEALRQNAMNLEAARAEYEKRRAAWSERRVEAESWSRIVERCRREEQQAAEQREQRDGEEVALAHRLARDLLFPSS